MIAHGSLSPCCECERMLALLDRYGGRARTAPVIADAQQLLHLLQLYSFRTSSQAERLCAVLSSRYRREILSLYGAAALLRRQSDSCYMRLEQLLSLLVRVAALRLARDGALPLSHAQLTAGDGMLLCFLEKEAQQKADG